MGIKYIWDTNTAIYYVQNKFPLPAEKLIDEIVDDYAAVISVITEIELLCWKVATANDIIILDHFISNCIIFELQNDIKLKTIEIRKAHGLKLPDAIIAATAIVMDLILITHDKGFKKITSLKLLNPIEAV